MLPNPVGQRLRVFLVTAVRIEIMIIGFVATEPFPSNVRGSKLVNMEIESRGTPS